MGDVVPGGVSSSDLGDAEASRRLSAPSSSRRLSFFGWGSSSNCTDKEPWDDGQGRDCSYYRSNLCDVTAAHPRGIYHRHLGKDVPKSHEVNFPEVHCCGCGRCQDTSSWTDGAGQTCNNYRASQCNQGQYTGGQSAHLINRPQLHCCGCGRCEDTPGWSDEIHGGNCEWYASQGICAGGTMDEAKLTQILGQKSLEELRYPDVHCCACGKQYIPSPTTTSTTSVTPSGSVDDIALPETRRRRSVTMEKPTKVPTDYQGALEYLSKVHVSALEDGGVPMEVTLTPLKWLVSQRPSLLTSTLTPCDHVNIAASFTSVSASCNGLHTLACLSCVRPKQSFGP